jgi:uroporphyrinogen-III synthase
MEHAPCQTDGMAFAVLTRDPADAAVYAAALAPLEVVAMPVTRTVAALDPEELRRLLAAGVDAIVIASPRAAQQLAHAAVADLPAVWAVGPATQRALEIAKIAARVPQGVRDGVELARALIAGGEVRGKKILVPRAEEGRTEPLELLRAAGAEVIEVIAYRTVPAPADDPLLARGRQVLVDGQAAVCCVFAPSQVAALEKLVPLGELRTRFCAIGETTAAAVKAGGIAEVAVAPAPTPEGMAQAVRSVYPARR